MYQSHARSIFTVIFHVLGEVPLHVPGQAAEVLHVLAEAHGLEDEALGALLRREGLHEGQLTEWRAAAAGALSQSAQAAPSAALTASQRRRLASSEKQVKEFERELRRKEKTLAETAALLARRHQVYQRAQARHPER